MGPAAHLTILWGGTPIRTALVEPGSALGIAEGGVVTSAPDPALLIRMHTRGATVSRRGSSGPLFIALGAESEIEIAAPVSASVYRSSARERQPIVLQIAVSTEDSRPFRRLHFKMTRALAIMLSVASAHIGAFAIARGAMPPLGATEDAAFRSESEDSWMFLPPISAEGDGPDPDDRLAEGPAACAGIDSPTYRRSIDIQGPSDNPDPHLSRLRPYADVSFFEMIGPALGPLSGDRFAPTVPWGRDDSLGTDPFSSTSMAPGGFDFDLTSCFGGRPVPPPCSDLDAPRLEYPRHARVVVGPIAVAANVPRWMVASGVRATIAESRACYERVLAEDPTLTGRFDAVLRVRGDSTSVDLIPIGDVADSPALACCLDHAQSGAAIDLPKGTVATALYSITFGRPRR